MDALDTTTTVDQADLERRVAAAYKRHTEVAVGLEAQDDDLVLKRQLHAKYLCGGLGQLPSAVSTLVTLGGADALQVVDRPKLHSFLLRMCVGPEQGGGMTMHEGGEVDVRGCYCALAACEMLLLDKAAVGEACGMIDYIRHCQSHEGGIGGEPWNEAHGGYTFCGLAAAVLLGKAQALDLDGLLRWAVRCQGQVEGGFMGRTNKLVDGCYSFWQGGAFPLLAALLAEQRQQPAATASAAPGSARSAPASPAVAAADAAAAGAAAQRVLSLLLDDGGDENDSSSDSADGAATSLTEWVARLPHLSPQAAASQRQQQLQKQLDGVVEAAIEAEERYTAAAGTAAGGPLQQEALALLEQASELQKACVACQQHLESLSSAAPAVLGQAVSSGGTAEGEGRQAQLPLLYDAAALQLWLLKCCQAGPRGGMRDKPGKQPDYYHTCYCLSGLSSSQHYSGMVLGGEQNLLVAADPVCNVVAVRLEAAQRYFRELEGQP
ncbi:Protein farnesyltransferase subunit beta [Chlorella vulgaris]